MKPRRPKRASSTPRNISKAKPSAGKGASGPSKTKAKSRAAKVKAKTSPQRKAASQPKAKTKAAKRSTPQGREHSHEHDHRHEHDHSHDHGDHDHDHDHDHGDHDHDHDHDHGDHDHDHDHLHIALPSVRPQPLIAVRDVEASARWYARLLGAERLGGDTQGNLYDRVLSDDQLVLQLHAWDKENHPNLVGQDDAQRGHGILLWFEVDDFDGAVERARELEAEILQEPHVNPGPQHREIWLRDPDGYVVVVVSPDGEVE